MVLLAVTGDPGIGKSTVVMRAADLLRKRGLRVGGIVSREIRKNGARIGFEFVDLATKEMRTLVSTSTAEKGPRVGRYIVSLEGCRFAAQRMINAIENCDVIVCDELGPMEFKSDTFVDCVKELLEIDKKATIVVVHKRLRHPVVEQFRKKASLVVDINLQNRNSAHSLLLEMVK